MYYIIHPHLQVLRIDNFTFNDKDICKVKLLPEQNAECKFKYIKGSKLYVYCNKHGLWFCDID